jgi:hypothetical protein
MNTKPKHQREGYRAYKAGKPIIDNPYPDRLRRDEWKQGWLAASHHAALIKLLTDSLEESA